MKKVLLSLVFLTAIFALKAQIIYVDAAAGGANDGTSWGDAYTTVQAALGAAGAGDQIRVAQGTYTGTFTMEDAVPLLGGYNAATGVQDPDVFTTTLDGQGVVDHVISINNNVQNVIIDGFIVTGGDADGGGDLDNGAAVFVAGPNSDLAMSNCTVESNTANGDGGAIYLKNGSPFSLQNVKFDSNTALNNGGAVYLTSGNLDIDDCKFDANQTTIGDGGALYIESGTVNIDNTEFTYNTALNPAGADGGAIFADGNSTTNVANCLFHYNSADDRGGAYFCSNVNSAANFTNTRFFNNLAQDSQGGAIYYNGEDDVFYTIGCLFANNESGGEGGAVYMAQGADYDTSIATAADGRGAVTNCTFVNNEASDGGGWKTGNAAAPPDFLNCIFWNNTIKEADDGPQATYTTTATTVWMDEKDPGNEWFGIDPSFSNPTVGSGVSGGDALAADFRLGCGAASSPFFDVGTDIGGLLATDIDGSARVFGTIDLGAYELTNSPPTDITLTPTDFDENVVGAPTLVGTLTTLDPQGDNDHDYSILAGGTFGAADFEIIGDELYVKAGSSFDFETDPPVTVEIQSTDRETCALSYTEILTITINDENDLPTNTLIDAVDTQVPPIAENAGLNALVGVISPIDEDGGGVYTYSLFNDGIHDADNAQFNFLANNLRANGSFDYETKNTYVINVRTTDVYQGTTLTYDELYTVTVTNVDESPTDIQFAPDPGSEPELQTSFVTTLTATDPDQFIGDDLDFDYTVTDDGGCVGCWSIGGAGADQLSLDIAQDYELLGPTYQFTIEITATDQDNAALNYSEWFVVNITNVDEAPTDITFGTDPGSEPENQSSVVTTLSGSDPDQPALDNDFDYSITDDGGCVGCWSIGGAGLDELQLDIDQDYEALGPGYRYVIEVTAADQDNGALTYSELYTVNITDGPDAPTAINWVGGDNGIYENNAFGDLIGNLLGVDEDANRILSYDKAVGAGDDDNALVQIPVGTDQVLALASYDYETQDELKIRVEVTDSWNGSQTYEEELTVSVLNVNETPTTLTFSTSPISIDENVVPGSPASLMGLFSTTDPDDIPLLPEGFTYTFTGGADDAEFNLAAGTGQLSSATMFNYEVRNQYTIRVRSTDDGSQDASLPNNPLFIERNFTVYINDVNDPPHNIILSNNKIQEEMAVGAFIGYLSAEDEDHFDNFSFELYEAIPGDYPDNSNFDITADGRLISDVIFDYETGNSYTIQVRVTDPGGATYEQELVIEIVDMVLPLQFTSHPIDGAYEGYAYRYIVTTSAEIFPPVITCTHKPAWMDFGDMGNGTAVLEIDPGNAVPGDYFIRLTGDNTGAPLFGSDPIVDHQFTLTVYPNNTITVNPGGSIQAAINSAPEHSVILVNPGTYNENIDLGSKNLLVTSQFGLTRADATVDATIISGSNDNEEIKSVITIDGGQDHSTQIVGFTIQNGNGKLDLVRNWHTPPMGFEGQYGGGILINGSSPLIDSCIVQFNSAKSFESSYGEMGGAGGGIFIANNADASLQFIDVLYNQVETYRGGGIAADNSYPVITYSLVDGNQGGNYGGGIGLFRCSTAVIHNTTIQNNSVSGLNGSGGGMFLLFTDTHFYENDINSNTTSEYASGMYQFKSDLLGQGNSVDDFLIFYK